MQEMDFGAKILEIVKKTQEGQFVVMEDLATGISTWSQEAVEYFGLPDTSISNTKYVLQDLVHPDDLPQWKQESDDTFAMKNDGFFCTAQLKNAKGEYVDCTVKGKIILGESGEPLFFAGSVMVHQGEELNDAITDLPKVQSFLKTVSRNKKVNRECLLIAIEIKRFNGINALYGYNFGSKALFEIAKIIKRIVGDDGTVYRLEGVTFGIVFQNCKLEYAQSVFEEIREALSKFSLDGTAINIEVYAGTLYTKNYMVSSQTIYSYLLSALEKE